MGQMSTFIFSYRVHQKDIGLAGTRAPGRWSGLMGASGFYPRNYGVEIGCKFPPPHFQTQDPPIGLLVKGVDCPVKMGGFVKGVDCSVKYKGSFDLHS